MYKSFLSWRYMRHRPTNLIGMVGIFVAVGALILILSIMTGFLDETRKAVRGSLADILIEPDFRGIQNPVPKEPGPILSFLSAEPGVVAATAHLRYGAMLTLTGPGAQDTTQIGSSATHGDLMVVEVVGVDVRGAERMLQPALVVAAAAVGGHTVPFVVHDELDISSFLPSLLRVDAEREEGKGFPGRVGDAVENPLFPFRVAPRTDDGYLRPRPGVVVGSILADDLQLRRGEVIQLATAVPSSDGSDVAVNNLEFVVSGTFNSRENEVDESRVYVDRTVLARLMGNTKQYSQILVQVDDYEHHAARVRDELRRDLAKQGLIRGGMHALYEVRTWEEFRANLLGAIENERVLMGIMLSLVLVVAGFTIFAILSMMVSEKRRDIGILCAVGATPSGVLRTFLWIAFWDALVGAGLGAAAGIVLALKIDPIERWLSHLLGVQIFNRDVYLFDHIPTVIIPLAVVLIVVGAFVCTLLFAALPAWRAARLDPLEALRYE